MAVKRTVTEKLSQQVNGLNIDMTITRPYGVDIEDLVADMLAVFKKAKTDPAQRGLLPLDTKGDQDKKRKSSKKTTRRPKTDSGGRSRRTSVN